MSDTPITGARPAVLDPHNANGNGKHGSQPDQAARIAEALQLLQLLYGDDAPGFLNLFTLPGQESHWLKAGNLPLIARQAILHSARRNVYFGVGVHPKALLQGRGDAAGVIALPAFWIDMDVLGPAHRATNLLPTADAALALIRSFPYPPTAIVNTGHGFHAYWCFRELWLLESDEERARAVRLVRRFQRWFQQRAQEQGCRIDSTHSLAQVLRVPGTINRKPELPDVPVELVHADDCRYNPRDDFEDWPELPDVEDEVYRAGGAGDFPPAPLGPILAGCAWMRHCRDDAKTLTEPEWYSMNTILARCQDGAKHAHAFSKPYPGYDPQETQEKFAHAAAAPGPHTCAYIHNSHGFAGCVQCPSREKIRSPIQLGSPQAATGTEKRPGKVSQATRLVELALSDSVELFHDGEVAFASFRAGDHQETHPLKTAGFRRHLINLYFQTEEGRAPGSQALQEALDTLEARAFRHGEKRQVFTRLAEQQGVIYLDLANDDWEAVAIGPGGWKIVRNPPVKFRRKAGMLSFPRPERGGCLDDLWKFANVQEGADRVLFVAALIAALRPTGPYPVLGLHGEQGTAKSTTARVFRCLADPNQAALRDAPDEARDLMVAATNSWMVAFDNLSGIPVWLSDSLCRLATGAGFGVRKNYTDDEEMLFVACRPILLTGIGEAASRPDLLDRSILLTLPVIAEDQRRDERTFWAEFETAQPRILGVLLDGLATALRNLPQTKLKRLPRMADFALWVTAAETGLGWESGTFMQAYEENRRDANSIALEASAIGDLIRALVREKGDIEKTKATDLLNLLADRADETATKRKDWPKNGRSLSTALKAIAPNLRAEGIEVSFQVSGGRWIALTRISESAKESANATPESGLRTPITHESPQTTGLNAKIPFCSEQDMKEREEAEETLLETEEIFADSANFADSVPRGGPGALGLGKCDRCMDLGQPSDKDANDLAPLEPPPAGHRLYMVCGLCRVELKAGEPVGGAG